MFRRSKFEIMLRAELFALRYKQNRNLKKIIEQLEGK